MKTLAGIDGNISSSVDNLSDLNVEKMEINVKEHNLKEQFKETTERMIQRNNMEIISKGLVENVIKNAVEELKNEKTSKKNYPRLAKQLRKMTILQKKLNHFIKIFFSVHQKLEDLNALRKRITINK